MNSKPKTIKQSVSHCINILKFWHKVEFFMIGDASLWGGLPCFDYARQNLPLISQDDFLQRMLIPAESRTSVTPSA